ncbi:MAG: DNA polymerase III subunit beta [Clostridia bacterium]|nr:DNA polymerase III subunit beta [Clostridia bacterium]MDD4386336.1 DNA polymerase III subunit beta [Clostridia bacterium]
MKINCETNQLINGLNVVFKTASSKTTMPILDGVLIEAYNNVIKLTTSDLEMSCTHTMKCNVQEEGSTVVDIRMLNEIMRKLEAEQITLESNDSLFIIKSVNGIFKLAVMNPLEYPKLPIFTISSSIEIKQKFFKDMIRKILFAVSTDENRPIYTGALLKVEDNILTLVALDGFRLALKKYLNDKEINNFKAIIPGRVLSEILKILIDNEEEVIKIGTNKNQALFEVGNSIIISRIIDGEFLNYNSIIPSNRESRIRVKTKKLLDTFERVALFAKESSDKDKKSPVKMNISLDGLTLSCISQTGDAKESIAAVLEGKDLEIGFNPRYFIETLKVIEDPEIYIDFTSSIAPAVIYPIQGNDYLYIVLPVKLRQE